MRNVFLPSLSSQLYGFGSNEVQIPNFDVAMQMECSGSNICTESRVLNHDTKLRGYHSTTLTCDKQSLLLNDEFSVPQSESDFQTAQNSRKRLMGTTEPLRHRVDSIKLCKKNKKEAKEQFQHHILKESNGSQRIGPQVPMRRSQKLGDKITALQKLVSPYGKTDTASVLQEARICIELLHKQIQNLFYVMSSTYNSSTAFHLQGIGVEKLDLKSRGMCLVPISITQILTKETSDSSSTYLKEKYQI